MHLEEDAQQTTETQKRVDLFFHVLLSLDLPAERWQGPVPRYHLSAIAGLLEKLPLERMELFLKVFSKSGGKRLVQDTLEQPYHPLLGDIDGAGGGDHVILGGGSPGGGVVLPGGAAAAQAAVEALLRGLKLVGFGDSSSPENRERVVGAVLFSRSVFYAPKTAELGPIECSALKGFKELLEGGPEKNGGARSSAGGGPLAAGGKCSLHVPRAMDLNRTSCAHEDYFVVHADDWTSHESIAHAAKDSTHWDWHNERDMDFIIHAFYPQPASEEEQDEEHDHHHKNGVPDGRHFPLAGHYDDNSWPANSQPILEPRWRRETNPLLPARKGKDHGDGVEGAVFYDSAAGEVNWSPRSGGEDHQFMLDEVDDPLNDDPSERVLKNKKRHAIRVWNLCCNKV